jgi:hypothetical protein
MRTKLKWSPGPGVKVLGIALQDAENWVVSAAAEPVGICPDCGARSRHRHGWHNRRLQDLPVQGQVVRINKSLSAKGAAQKAKGGAQQAKGKLKDAVKNAVDKT